MSRVKSYTVSDKKSKKNIDNENKKLEDILMEILS